jgi:hypothetical protein
MELSTESLEAACKLAYELGQQRANNDWDLLMKEASWKQLGSEFLGGVKALANRQTFQSGRQAARSAMKDPALTGAAGGFGDLARTAGQQMSQPFKNVYQTFRGKGYQGAIAQGEANVEAAAKRLRAATSPEATQLAQAELQAAQQGLDTQLRSYSNYGFSSPQAARAAGSRNYFGAGGALEGQGANVAAAVGAGALGTAGIYGAGRMVAGSPQNTYVTNVQSQQAPHQYYLDQLSNMFS